MKNIAILITLCVSIAAYAQESDQSTEQLPTLREILSASPKQTNIPKKKPTQPAIKKGATYLLTYQAEDNQWYEDEAVATGRYATFCDGVRYEVDAGDFTYFAKAKQLRRIYQ